MACAGDEPFELVSKGSVDNVDELRVAFETDGDAYAWLTQYSEATNTSWIVDWEIPNPTRFVFHKKWRCQHRSLNKTAGKHSTNCPAFVDIKIKKVTKATKRNDPFLNRPVPLTALIKLHEVHNHVLDCADGLRLLKPTSDTRAAFFRYFENDMTPAVAIAHHKEKLASQEERDTLLASSAVNPPASTVYHWFRGWRRGQYGSEGESPLSKLNRRAPEYLERGVDVRTWTSKDGSSWAVLVVTAIMSRTQALGTAKEMVFLDSTASCDETQSTVTVVLTATPVGAMPLAVLLHSSQSTESYKAAFDLLKQSYPLCFGGVPAPQCFMTDNSAAERAALEATWPEATRLLCHFHVAQAEWRWLQASRNQIMYAASAADLEAAIEQLHDMNHKEYVQRVTTFLERKADKFEVPSGKLDEGTVYQVCMDLGICTCQSGQQGAFCKHQALVHHRHGGNFLNAPVVTSKDRHQLGLLALGDNCPDEDFFRDFRDNFRQEASTSRPTGQGQSAEPEPQQPMDTEPQLEAQGSTGSCHQHEEEQWRHHSLAAGNPYYTTALRKMLDHMRKIGKESQVVSSYLAMNAACASARRRGRTIKVQPTSIARRRPGVNRGAGRVPAGRPTKSSASKKVKRPHTLHLSVRDGWPHAKSHGAGH
ncbi:hypothetical protein HPB48_022772 [Haemaphysalis longicornis]|uniref:SWIM-type domain-containing protein n=1 Tax=Haemaphysalis longicornis TaxID=44386 RepID=A0A9J6FKS6_HAELO|nr:hypothetical protein HPB48_022772 [Haemaphysalis longicornis]